MRADLERAYSEVKVSSQHHVKTYRAKQVSHQAMDLAAWNVQAQTPPRLTHQTLRYNEFRCWTYDFRQASTHLTCRPVIINLPALLNA